MGDRIMTARTLVADKQYYGLEATRLLQAATRVLLRVAGMPPERARVSARHLQQDFAVNTMQGQVLVREFVEGGLLQRHGHQDDFQLTPRFLEVASARVVEPMTRAKAKQIVAVACKTALRINADWTRNPVMVDALAVSGSYMSRSDKLSDLMLGIVVKKRPAQSRFSFWRKMNTSDGAIQIQNEFRELSSFVNAYIAIDTQGLVRPFSIVFRGDGQD
jgi:hypothetical protein